MTTLELPTAPVIEVTHDELRELGVHTGTFTYWDKDKQRAWLNKAKEKGRPETPHDIKYVVSRFSYHLVEVMILPNYYSHTLGQEEHSWEKALINGRSYMVGSDVPMEKFIKDHRSPLSAWQKKAYEWVKENPLWKLNIETKTQDWDVYCRGMDFVEFGLPHQDMGGERHYVTRDGRSKILVNVD